MPGLIDSWQMNKLEYAMKRLNIWFALLTMIGSLFCGLGYTGELPQTGSQYKIVGPVYLMAAYDDLNNRQLNRGAAHAYLHSELYAKTSYVAFQCQVPVGTVVTIIGSAPKRLPLWFIANQFIVHLDPPMLSVDLEVVLELNRGIEGGLDGLNPGLFDHVTEEAGKRKRHDGQTSNPCDG